MSRNTPLAAEGFPVCISSSEAHSPYHGAGPFPLRPRAARLNAHERTTAVSGDLPSRIITNGEDSVTFCGASDDWTDTPSKLIVHGLSGSAP